MLKIKLSLLGVLLLSSAVLAQGSAMPTQPKVLGKTVNVEGLVTVSDGVSVASVLNDLPVSDGERYVTSSTGKVTLRFENCEVKLEPNQAVTVDERKICEGMILAIDTLPGGAAGAGGGFNPGLGLAILIGAAVLSGGNGSSSNANNPNISNQ